MKKQNIALFFLLGTGLFFAQNKENAATATPAATSATTSKYTDEQKASYYIGNSIAQNMKNQGFNVDVEMLAKGMKDELSGGAKVFPAEEMNAFMQGFSQKMNEKKMAEQKLIAEANKKKSAEFLEKNKQNPNVKTTASGLQYEVLSEGDGKGKPAATDMVKVTYTGKLTDGTVFDSTDKNGGQPIEFALNGVIKGWTEGIQLMSKGAKYRFYIPSELGYGENGAGNVIPPSSVLVFDVNLLDFKKPEATAAPQSANPSLEKKETAKKPAAAPTKKRSK